MGIYGKVSGVYRILLKSYQFSENNAHIREERGGVMIRRVFETVTPGTIICATI